MNALASELLAQGDTSGTDEVTIPAIAKSVECFGDLRDTDVAAVFIPAGNTVT